MRPLTIIAGLAIAALTVHEGSNWWEKAWGTHLYTELSPDGCLRLEAYKPYWVLPSILQTQPWHDGPSTWGNTWEAPTFYRLYVADSGVLLGETPTFDGHFAGEMLWGLYPTDSGHTREITVDGYAFVETKHCTDPRSRQLMRDYYWGNNDASRDSR